MYTELDITSQAKCSFREMSKIMLSGVINTQILGMNQ